MPSPSSPTAVAFIPARSGSKRVPHKNIRPLNGHPLLAYSIAAARRAAIFDAVIVATDSAEYAAVARHYGAEVPFLRPSEISDSHSPDIEWVLHMLDGLQAAGRGYDCFSILRPTSPFRKASTIERAWATFTAATGVDSLRAVERVEQHPGKMWVVRGERLLPLLPLSPAEKPWHSQQMAVLPEVYVQNASLEIAWTEMARRTGSIAGTSIVPFLTQGDEGVDINNSHDWWYVQHLMEQGEAVLPVVDEAPWVAAAPV